MMTPSKQGKFTFNWLLKDIKRIQCSIFEVCQYMCLGGVKRFCFDNSALLFTEENIFSYE